MKIFNIILGLGWFILAIMVLGNSLVGGTMNFQMVALFALVYSVLLVLF